MPAFNNHPGGQPAVKRATLPSGKGEPRPLNGHCQLHVVRTEGELDALEERWSSLISCSDVSAFQTFEWMRTWWKYFGTNRRLHSLIVTEEGRTIGIAPMFLEDARILGLRVATRLRFMGCGISDYCDFIIARGKEEPVLHAFAHYLLAHSGEWDIFEVADVNERAQLYKILPRLLKERGMGVYTYQGNVCPSLALPGSWEGFLAGLGQKMRHHLKKKREMLNRQYRTEVEIFKSASDDIDLAVNEFIQIHERRWKSLGFRSAFDDEVHREFHYEVARRMARRGWLRLFFLKVDGRRVAVSFDFNFNKRIHVYLSHACGPEEIMKCSPGFLIRCIAIDRGIAEGMEIYDLLRGNEAYKYEELKCVRSENWLVRGVGCSRKSRARFRIFLVGEFAIKCFDRIRREYHEFRRFAITKKPTTMASLRFFQSKLILLYKLGVNYCERFFFNESQRHAPR